MGCFHSSAVTCYECDLRRVRGQYIPIETQHITTAHIYLDQGIEIHRLKTELDALKTEFSKAVQERDDLLEQVAEQSEAIDILMDQSEEDARDYLDLLSELNAEKSKHGILWFSLSSKLRALVNAAWGWSPLK